MNKIENLEILLEFYIYIYACVIYGPGNVYVI